MGGGFQKWDCLGVPGGIVYNDKYVLISLVGFGEWPYEIHAQPFKGHTSDGKWNEWGGCGLHEGGTLALLAEVCTSASYLASGSGPLGSSGPSSLNCWQGPGARWGHGRILIALLCRLSGWPEHTPSPWGCQEIEYRLPCIILLVGTGMGSGRGVAEPRSVCRTLAVRAWLL